MIIFLSFFLDIHLSMLCFYVPIPPSLSLLTSSLSSFFLFFIPFSLSVSFSLWLLLAQCLPVILSH